MGSSPVVYVIDTGASNHPDLNVLTRINFAGGTDNDCNGHGTHVAGTAAARDNSIDVVGVAPGARVVAVKVLDCNGSGQTSSVIKGVDWVTANAVVPNSVANMSLGGSANTQMDNAVRNSATRGIFYALAAGNNGANACSYSPSRLGGSTANVVVVAATDEAGREASFSNTGTCVDIWAPGVGVRSTNFRGGTSTLSGTSMASPHVAGAAALAIGLALRNNQPVPSATELQSRFLSSAKPTGATGKSVLLGSAPRQVQLLDAEIK